jgi:pseudouridine synthase
MTEIRLNKFLAQMGIASRREADRFIAEGSVSVNGKVVEELGTKIDPENDRVTVEESQIKQKKDSLRYYMLNKPTGYVSTTHRTESEPKIVTDLMPNDAPRIYPIGRLDKESTGLLLLTNDGDLAFRLMHPKFEHEKEYFVESMNPIIEDQLKQLEKGIPLLGKKTLPPKIIRLSPRTFRITLKEGMNRQIRRMFRKIGSGVRILKRIRIENLYLPKDMKEGEVREILASEIPKLFPQRKAS